MNLLKIKDCIKCRNSIYFGDRDNCEVHCTSSDYVAQELFKKDNRHCAMYCKQYIEGEKLRNGKIEQADVLEFILAGNSEFILHSTKTNEDFRFILEARDSDNNKSQTIFFVFIVKSTSKIYAGVLWFDKEQEEFKYSPGDKGNISSDMMDIRSLIFVLNRLYNKSTVQNLEVYSVCKCGVCNKYLESEDEMKIGIHSMCKAKINFEKIYKYT